MLSENNHLRKNLVIEDENFFDSLKAKFPNFNEVIDFYKGQFRLKRLTGKTRIQPILLLGEAGVGKTYAMLEAAHEAKKQGIDVVAGYIEPHARPATAALVNGLEVISPLVINHKDITLNEFNLDAAIKAKNFSKENISILKPLKTEIIRYGVKIDVKESINTNGYNNVTETAKYIKWLADSLIDSHESEKMYNWLIAKRGIKPANRQEMKAGLGEFQSLDKDQESKVLDTVRPDSLSNPWKGDAVKYRNQLIVNLLLDIGCRKGESLNIKTTDLVQGVGVFQDSCRAKLF